jgi:hypothetical protein
MTQLARLTKERVLTKASFLKDSFLQGIPSALLPFSGLLDPLEHSTCASSPEIVDVFAADCAYSQRRTRFHTHWRRVPTGIVALKLYTGREIESKENVGAI